MNNGSDTEAEDPWWPFVAFAIIGLFVLMGPPIGALTVWLGIALFARSAGSASETITVTLATLPYSYMIGGPFALASGIVHAIAAIGLRRYSVRVPLIASFAIAAIGVGLALLIWPRQGTGAKEYLQAVALIAPSCVVASFCCWALTRRLAAGSARRAVQGTVPPLKR